MMSTVDRAHHDAGRVPFYWVSCNGNIQAILINEVPMDRTHVSIGKLVWIEHMFPYGNVFYLLVHE